MPTLGFNVDDTTDDPLTQLLANNQTLNALSGRTRLPRLAGGGGYNYGSIASPDTGQAWSPFTALGAVFSQQRDPGVSGVINAFAHPNRIRGLETAAAEQQALNALYQDVHPDWNTMHDLAVGGDLPGAQRMLDQVKEKFLSHGRAMPDYMQNSLEDYTKAIALKGARAIHPGAVGELTPWVMNQDEALRVALGTHTADETDARTKNLGQLYQQSAEMFPLTKGQEQSKLNWADVNAQAENAAKWAATGANQAAAGENTARADEIRQEMQRRKDTGTSYGPPHAPTTGGRNNPLAATVNYGNKFTQRVDALNLGRPVGKNQYEEWKDKNDPQLVNAVQTMNAEAAQVSANNPGNPSPVARIVEDDPVETIDNKGKPTTIPGRVRVETYIPQVPRSQSQQIGGIPETRQANRPDTQWGDMPDTGGTTGIPADATRVPLGQARQEFANMSIEQLRQVNIDPRGFTPAQRDLTNTHAAALQQRVAEIRRRTGQIESPEELQYRKQTTAEYLQQLTGGGPPPTRGRR